MEHHGWDPSLSAWYGPDEFEYSLSGCQTILSKLRALPGSWYGRLRSPLPGGLPVSFWVTARDLEDAGLVTLDMEGLHGGPLQSMLIVPAQRRCRVRSELAFEFVSFLRFLEGPASAGDELAIQDYMERVITGGDKSKTLVFSVESRFVPDDARLALLEQSDRLASSMIAWLAERDTHHIDTAGAA